MAIGKVYKTKFLANGKSYLKGFRYIEYSNCTVAFSPPDALGYIFMLTFYITISKEIYFNISHKDILTNLTKSMTGALGVFSFSNSATLSTPTKDHNLSKLRVGQNLC